MPSMIDFAISVGVFLSFLAVIIFFLISYLNNYFNLASLSELRTVSFDIYTGLFTGPGLPSNWENSTNLPLKVGLMSSLYKLPLNVTETNGTYRGQISINSTIIFDLSCQRKAWNTTIRVYNSSLSEIPSSIYNPIMCTSQYVNSSEIVFNVTLNANENKLFYVFYSPENYVTAQNYSVDYPVNVTNYTVQMFPEQELKIVSVSKLLGLKNLDYDQLLQTLGTNLQFRLEVGASR